MMDAAQRRAALETEADRIKGRLDQFHAQLSGDPDAWLDITVRMPDTVAEVTVDKVLAEARQQALALATIVKALDGAAAREDDGTAAAEDPADALQRRREEKARAAAAATA
jgi:DNA-binding GntR family transcriptional regulator